MVNSTEITVKQFEIVKKTYEDMINRGINLSDYIIVINYDDDNNYILISYIKPIPGQRGASAEYPSITYKVDIVSGDIINIIYNR